jgi:hypothetical protein
LAFHALIQFRMPQSARSVELREFPAGGVSREQALAYVHLARELALELEKHVALPDLNLSRVPIDEGQPLQSVDIEQAAAQVRNHWNVPGGPVRDVVRLLEMNGIVVVRFRVSIEKVDAFCVDFPDRPVVALGADKSVFEIFMWR